MNKKLSIAIDGPAAAGKDQQKLSRRNCHIYTLILVQCTVR